MGKTVAVHAGSQSVHTHSNLRLRYLLLGVLCCLVSFLTALYLESGSALTTHADSGGGAMEGSAANFTLSTRGDGVLGCICKTMTLLFDRSPSICSVCERAEPVLTHDNCLPLQCGGWRLSCQPAATPPRRWLLRWPCRSRRPSSHTSCGSASMATASAELWFRCALPEGLRRTSPVLRR